MQTNVKRFNKTIEEVRSSIKKACDALEGRVLTQFEAYSLEPVRGQYSPFYKKLTKMIKTQVQTDLQAEIEAMNKEEELLEEE